MEPDYSLLHFIREGKPIAFDDVLQLWERTRNYIVVETVVDIAINEKMPLWAAEQHWQQWWKEYRLLTGFTNVS